MSQSSTYDVPRSDARLYAKRARYVTIISHELVATSIKYAFQGSTAHIRVFTGRLDNSIQLIYHDDGWH